jgi:hypothetical protein
LISQTKSFQDCVLKVEVWESEWLSTEDDLDLNRCDVAFVLIKHVEVAEDLVQIIALNQLILLTKLFIRNIEEWTSVLFDLFFNCLSNGGATSDLKVTPAHAFVGAHAAVVHYWIDLFEDFLIISEGVE